MYNNPEAPTPHLLELASEGIVLNRHYVYQFCSPTRSSLMSGRLPIHVNTVNHPSTEPGGVDLRMQTLPEALRTANYSCHTAGKWCAPLPAPLLPISPCYPSHHTHSREPPTGPGFRSNPCCALRHAGGHLWGQLPTERGFDTSLNYLNGMEDHYTQYFNQLGGYDLWHGQEEGDGGAPAIGMNGTYGAFLYVAHLVEAVKAHPFPKPLFLYGAWQNTVS